MLNRKQDVSGVSGTGIIADGVVFGDGQAVIHWRGKWHTIEVLRSVQDVVDIHGHGGATALEWIDDTPRLKDYGEA